MIKKYKQYHKLNESVSFDVDKLIAKRDKINIEEDRLENEKEITTTQIEIAQKKYIEDIYKVLNKVVDIFKFNTKDHPNGLEVLQLIEDIYRHMSKKKREDYSFIESLSNMKKNFKFKTVHHRDQFYIYDGEITLFDILVFKSIQDGTTNAYKILGEYSNQSYSLYDLDIKSLKELHGAIIKNMTSNMLKKLNNSA